MKVTDFKEQIEDVIGIFELNILNQGDLSKELTFQEWYDMFEAWLDIPIYYPDLDKTERK